jgi:hypothetical protein
MRSGVIFFGEIIYLNPTSYSADAISDPRYLPLTCFQAVLWPNLIARKELL